MCKAQLTLFSICIFYQRIEPISKLSVSMSSEVKTSWVTHVRVFTGIYLMTCMPSLVSIWGNISVYTISYFHFRVREDTEATSSWMITTTASSWSLGMLLSKRIQRQFGVRVTMTTGCLGFTGSLVLCFLSVQHSFVAFIITLGFMCGFFTGVTHGVQITLLTMWTGPRKLGLACCSILSSQQIGAVLFNLVTTWYINPNNLKSNVIIAKPKMFSQPELLDRIPNVFILVGAISLVLACISFLFVKVKPDNKTENEENETTQASIVDKENVEMKNSIDSLAGKSNANTRTANMERIKYVVSNDYVTDIQNMTQEMNITASKSSHLNVDYGSRHDIGSETVIETNELADPTPCDLTPRQALKTVTLFVLMSIIIVTGTTFAVMGSYYKLFGMLYYDDDHFFTNTSVAMNIGTLFTISFAGFVCDKIDMKKTVMGNVCLMCIFSGVFYLSVRVSKLFYCILVVIFWGTASSAYILVSVCFIRYFGNTHATTIYGLAAIVGDGFNFIIPIFVRYILTTFGWMELYTCLCGINVICLLFVVFGLPAKSNILDRKTES